MSEEYVIALARDAMGMALLLAAPALVLGLAVGLIISILQATTQIQEQTLTFVPKIVAVMLALVIFGGWMLNTMVTYTNDLFANMLNIIR